MAVHGVLPKHIKGALRCAFANLETTSKGEVPKAQLQTVCVYVSEAVQRRHQEQQLMGYLPHREALTFDEFLRYVQSYLVKAGDRAYFKLIEQSCWRTFCRERYLRVSMQWTRLGPSEEVAFKLWRIFNALSVDNTISPHEGLCLQDRILQFLHCTSADEDELTTLPRRYTFWHFLAKIVEGFPNRVDAGKVQAAVEDLEDEILLDIVKQGPLNKKGYMRYSWKERWFTLTPGMLKYYTGRDKEGLKGVIYINKRTKVERVEGKDKHQNRMAVTCGDTGTVHEMAAASNEEIELWMATIRFASHCNSRTVFEHAVIEKQKHWGPSIAAKKGDSHFTVKKFDAVSCTASCRNLKSQKEAEKRLLASTCSEYLLCIACLC